MRQKWALVRLAPSASPLHSLESSHLRPRSVLANKQTNKQTLTHVRSFASTLVHHVALFIKTSGDCESTGGLIASSKYLLNQTVRSLWHTATPWVSLSWQSRGAEESFRWIMRRVWQRFADINSTNNIRCSSTGDEEYAKSSRWV